MALDLSSHDAELDALGSEPEDLARLVADYAEGAVPSDLAGVDALLGVLGDAVAAPSAALLSEAFAPATVEQPLDEAGPPSGEYSLGPMGNKSSSEAPLERSGELSLDAEPHSGSFELPSASPDDGASEDPAAAMEAALSEQALDAGKDGPDTEQVDLGPYTDSSEQTQVGEPEAIDAAVAESVAPEPVAEADELDEPDVDGMFDELTRRSSAPPGPNPEDESAEAALCADDDLAGIDDMRNAPDVEADLARLRGEVSEPVEPANGDDEATEVFSADDFAGLADEVAAEQAAAAVEGEPTVAKSSVPPPPEDEAMALAVDFDEEGSASEIDLDELEVMLDEEILDADESQRSAPPPLAGLKGPSAPPALPSSEPGAEAEGAEDGTPSFLGRLLGKKKRP